MEYTVALIKPDAMRKRLRAEIKAWYMRAGLTIVMERKFRLTEGQVARFYAEHKGRHYYDALVLAMTSGPITALLLMGDDAINRVRTLNGATKPEGRLPGTIRHAYPSGDGPFNIVHGSDSPDAVRREAKIVFRNAYLPKA